MGAWGSDAWGEEEYEGSTATLDPVADIEFDCTDITLGEPGIIRIGMSILPEYTVIGEDGSLTEGVCTITIGFSFSGSAPGDVLHTDSTITIPFKFCDRGGDVAFSLISDSSWVWTSRIGSLDFEPHTSGEVNQMAMEHGGVINKIMKLGSAVIVYGDMGITKLTPAGIHWGRIQVHKLGIISKNAATGTDYIHYFVDKLGILYRLTIDSLPEMLDYSHIMGSLSSDTVMSYDERRGTVYITDGTLGYALTKDGLGECPPTITGVGYRDGTFYTVSPAAITNSPFEITTDIVDFGTRYQKIIMSLLIGMSATESVYTGVDYRQKKSDSWSSSNWTLVDDEGIADFDISAVEFRFKIKLTTYEAVQLDYFNVIGEYIDREPIEGAV